MRLRTVSLGLVIAATVSVAMAGCSINDAISPDGATPPPPGHTLTDVQRILETGTTPNCASSGCHLNNQGGLTITMSQTTAQLWTVLLKTPGADGKLMIAVGQTAANSWLLQKPDSANPGVTHTGQKLWSSTAVPPDPNYSTILRWASSGAPIQ